MLILFWECLNKCMHTGVCVDTLTSFHSAMLLLPSDRSFALWQSFDYSNRTG